jgi:hypothetical protein
MAKAAPWRNAPKTASTRTIKPRCPPGSMTSACT